MENKEEVLTLSRAESEFGSYYEIKIGDKTTGKLCPDEALGFIAHKLFRGVGKEHLYGLDDIPQPKDKALQEYVNRVHLCPMLRGVLQEINSRLKALEAANEKA